MYLIPPQVLEGKIDDYFAKMFEHRPDWELIGYWPAREQFYFCVSSQNGPVAPVWLGYAPRLPEEGAKCQSQGGPDWWAFDSEYTSKKTKGGGLTFHPTKKLVGDWVLFFAGCDDGDTGKRFESKQAALNWIADCPEIDFYEVVLGVDKETGKHKDYGLEYAN